MTIPDPTTAGTVKDAEHVPERATLYSGTRNCTTAWNEASVTHSQAPFEIAAYEDVIAGLRGRGYALEPLARILPRYDGQRPPAFIRHDVDVDLAAALVIGEVDAALGVESTFFVSLQSPFFNVLSSPALRTLDRLSELGHELAAHIDLRDLRGSLAALDLVPRLVPAMRVDLVTVHCPPDNAPTIDVPGLENVQRVLDDRGFKYLSDSLGSWREGHPGDHAAPKTGVPLHINTHPTWWVEPRTPSSLEAVPPRFAARSDTEWWFPKLTRKLAAEREAPNDLDVAAEPSDV